MAYQRQSADITPSSTSLTLRANDGERDERSDMADLNEKAIEAGGLTDSRAETDSTSNGGEDPELGKIKTHTTNVETSDKSNNLEKQPTAVSAHSPAAFPDGGIKAWLCVAGGWACLFCSFGWINCIGIFQEYYQQNQLKAYSSSTVSWIPSLETWCMFVGGAIVGKLFDAYGPRAILAIGTFLHVFGLMMASISTQYWHFILSQGIVSAAGASMIFYPAIGSVSTWFFKRRAFALGVMASGSSMGGVIFPIMIRKLIPEVGFGWTMRITAFMILSLMIVANLTLTSRLPPKGWKGFSAGEFIRPFKEPAFLVTVLASFFFFWGMFLPFTYLPAFAEYRGMSADLSGYIVSILNAASVIGRILPGYIGDRLGRYNTMTVLTYFSAILVFALWLPSTGNIPIIIFAALYGFSTGAFVSIGPSLIAQISDIREIGVRNGAMFGFTSFAALTGSPIGGALLTKYHGGYLGMQIFAGVCLTVGSTGFLLCKMYLSKNKIWHKV